MKKPKIIHGSIKTNVKVSIFRFRNVGKWKQNNYVTNSNRLAPKLLQVKIQKS